jgi:hypothetical protein
LRINFSLRIKRWEIAVVAKQISGRSPPTFDEGSLELLDNRPFDSYIGLAPVLRSPSIASPGLAHPVTAGKTDSSIDHKNATMTAMIII